MSMKLGYDLTIEQTQKLVMTPELIQAIKILQYNVQELDAYVQEQILTNPVLEQESPLQEIPEKAAADESMSWQEYIRNSVSDDSSYRQWEERREDEEGNPYDRYAVTGETLPEHLLFQLQFAVHSPREQSLGEFIIQSLDENGYLTLTPEEIAEAFGCELELVDHVISLIHNMDPLGVGARNLQDCLLIQLRHLGLLTDAFRLVVSEHLEDLANNRLQAIARATSMSTAEVQKMGDIIRTLEPKPGRQFATGEDTRFIIPDLIVEKTDEGCVVVSNDSSSPQLKISPYYRKLLHQAEDDAQLSDYLSDRVNAALWLIRSIDQRKQTIYNVADSVVRHQKEFFDKGPKYMKTMTLKDIAEDVGIHESTVSRSINGKYLQCAHGIFELRHFFSAGVSDGQGEGISSSSIKEFIKEIVDGEDPKKPYSDQAIAEILERKGFAISRRTVAKYRDELQILSSSRRRRY